MLIINAEIHTLDKNNTIIRNGFLETENDKIISVGNMSELNKNTDNAIDAERKSIYPGFIDAHTHIGVFEDSISFEGSDGNEDTDPVTPNLRVVDGINSFDGYFNDALRAGITTVVVSPGSTNVIGGSITAIKTVGRQIDNMILRDPVAIKFALGENPKSTYNDREQTPVTRMAIASLIRENLCRAKKYLENKENEENYSEYDPKCEALIPLIEKKIPAHFHVHRADDIFTAIRICKEFDLNYVLVHATDAHLITDELKKENAVVLSGPFLTDRSKPELKNLSPEAPGILSSSGIKTAIITDHPEIPISFLNICAAVAVREGMEHEEALKALTINPAEICGISHQVGSLEKGKDADLFIIDGDPLNIMNKPEMVIVNGETAYNVHK